MTFEAGLEGFVGPRIVGVRGPSRSGKTAMCERLIARLAPGVRVAYLKRTHHQLDLPHKASGRIWTAGPAAMVLRATDRVQLTIEAVGGGADALVEALPAGIDLVLLETHSAEPYPTVVSKLLDPKDGDVSLGRFALDTMDADADRVAGLIRSLLPADRELDLALRGAIRAHGHHCCAGLVLGTRLSLLGSRSLGLEIPDRSKRLVVTVETDRCAFDAVQAVTGCRPGKRTLRFRDYGKLAATFFDEHTGRAIRVAARGDLRGRVTVAAGENRHEAQRRAYLSMPPAELFDVREVDFALDQFDLPGPPRRRVLCTACGEEVSDGREIVVEAGPLCRPCAETAGTIPDHQRSVRAWR